MQKVLLLLGLALSDVRAKRSCKLENDLQTVFSPCARNSTRAAFFYWAEDCEGEELPAPIWDLRCDVECPEGSVLGLDLKEMKSACQPCPAHTYSLSGLERFSGAHGDWLAGQHYFSSYCWASEKLAWRREVNCSIWRSAPAGEHIASGKTYSSGLFQQDLVYFANLTKPGRLKLRYTKTNSHFGISNGIFQVTVNSRSVLIDNSPLKEHQNDVVAELSPGATEVIMSLRKFGDLSSSVSISDFEVSGLLNTAHFCLPCIGGVSASEASDCVPCPANTFLSNLTCEQCPNSHFSPPGSTGANSCLPRLNCTNADFSVRVRHCKAGKRSVEPFWLQPMICKPGIELPNEIVEVPCDSCNAGYFLKTVDAEEQECSSCPDGWARDEPDTLTSCTPCPAGTYAPRAIHVAHWSPLPDGIEIHSEPTACKRLLGWHVSSGLFNASYLNSSSVSPGAGCDFSFQRIVNISRIDASVSFLLTFNKSTQSRSYFQFEINGQSYARFTESLSDSFEKISISLDPGAYSLRWVHHQEDSDHTDVCLIYSILITGTEDGGAQKCQECPANHFSEEASTVCLQCPAGFTHTAGHLGCKMCPPDTVSDPSGCLQCPTNTEATDNHTHCVGLDVLKIDGAVFNITQLTGRNTSNICASSPHLVTMCRGNFYGPVVGRSDTSFYLSVMNAGKATSLPHFQAKEDSFAYAWGLFPIKAHSREPECTQLSQLVNLGSALEDIQMTTTGFQVTYLKGALCNNASGDRYSTEINFVCDKYEDEGWPQFTQQEKCRFAFEWRTKFACRFCAPTELLRVKGPCNEGSRQVHVYEPEMCRFFLNTSSEVHTEHCSDASDFVRTWPALLGAITIALLVAAICVLVRKLCNVQYMYMRLLQETDPRPDKDN